MRVLVADVENSVYRHEDRRIDNGPYRSSNRLVSVGYKFVGEETVNYDFYYHKELDKPADPAKFQAALDQADLLVGHNVKHDTEWLLESGFTYDGPVFDTMIAAYVLNRGQKAELSLEDLCIRYGLPLKKAELISDLWHKGVGFEEMPIEIVEEYGRADVVSTEALYLKMLEEYEKPDNIRLKPVLSLMNEFCFVLAEVERNGIQIDLNALDEVEREFLEEREQLQRSLMDLTHELMGDRPINLNSPEQLSWVLFSRKVKDKNEWARVFNIGVDHRGKPKPRPRMGPDVFRQNVSRHTEVLYRQKAHQCADCKGTGRIQKFKKDGTPYKNTNRCKTCDATGLVYEDLKKIAGLKLKPGGIKDVSANGFSTSKDALQFYANSLRGQGNEVGAQFLENMIRLNAVDSYLSTFVNGIRRATIPQTSRLHTNFNQCVTATGRLSSSDPNFQNQPRGNTFPVRRCVVSRFEGGSIIEADFCVAPETRILTADLRWVHAEDIKEGDELIGFNEQFTSMRDITMQGSVVERTKVLHKPCVRITTTHGTVVCSEDHHWVARKDKKKAEWYRADELQAGDTISRYVEPWEQSTTWDGAWMAGVLDGEGYISGSKCEVGQNPGIVLDNVRRVMEEHGFSDISVSISQDSNVHKLRPNGEQQGIRMVGMFRPHRLLAKSRKMWEGRRTWGKRTVPATILSVEKIGCQKVIAIQTSTRTFIAEGMLSHNCQLEFRVAGFLAQDQQVLYDVMHGVDVHSNTAKALTEAGEPTDRQGAKRNSFKPLYGGQMGTPAEMAYFDFFLNRYSGIAEWHERLCETALRTGIVSIPSGREYAFPNAERMWNGNVRGRTQIVNYPVQGFATADIVPLACIRLYRLMKKHKVKSLFVLQVHDSIVIDCYPGEEELMAQLLTEAMVYIAEEMKERWGIEYNFPVAVEIARGSNWMNTEVVAEQEWRPEESERMSA